MKRSCDVKAAYCACAENDKIIAGSFEGFYIYLKVPGTQLSMESLGPYILLKQVIIAEIQICNFKIPKISSWKNHPLFTLIVNNNSNIAELIP